MKLFYVGAGPSPRLLVRSGDRPDHLAATAIGCRYKKLAYVVEGHASACPRTVGVDVGMWASAGKCGEMSVMCKFHIKTYHMSNSQNCLSLFQNFSTFYRVCVLTYVIERYASTYLRNGGRLNVCGVDDNVLWL